MTIEQQLKEIQKELYKKMIEDTFGEGAKELSPYPEIFSECEDMGCVRCAYKVESKSPNENLRDCMHRRILRFKKNSIKR